MTTESRKPGVFVKTAHHEINVCHQSQSAILPASLAPKMRGTLVCHCPARQWLLGVRDDSGRCLVIEARDLSLHGRAGSLAHLAGLNIYPCVAHVASVFSRESKPGKQTNTDRAVSRKTMMHNVGNIEV